MTKFCAHVRHYGWFISTYLLSALVVLGFFWKFRNGI